MTNPIAELHKAQRAVYDAFARKVEVETRDYNWNRNDAAEAEEVYQQAISSYKAAYDMEPEYSDTVDIVVGRRPLEEATTERMMTALGGGHAS